MTNEIQMKSNKHTKRTVHGQVEFYQKCKAITPVD